MGFWSKIAGFFGGEGPPRGPEQVFVEWCLAEARRHPAVAAVEPGEGPDLPLHVRLKDGGEQQLFLKNTFLETRELPPEEKVAMVRRLLNAFTFEHKLGWEDAMPAIVPLVRISTFGGAFAKNAFGHFRRW